MHKRPQIIVMGAGFGGLQTAVSLGGAPADVWLIDRNAYHTFVPLVYQVATATLLPEHIAFPVQTLCRRHANLRFVQAEVQTIDPRLRQVQTDRTTLDYDYLVIATGSKVQWHDVSGAADYAKSLRTLTDAVQLRQHILNCFEQAAWEPDPTRRSQLLTFTIVGGGATGVEMAGALIELVRGPLRWDYPMLEPQQVRVILLQSGPQLLTEFPQRLGAYTARRLRQVGVEVELSARVNHVTSNRIYLEDGREIETSTVIWVAGVTAAVPVSSPPLGQTPRQKLEVGPTLQLLDSPEIYAIGDVASPSWRGATLADVAPVALQQGVATARNLRRQLAHRPPRPFRYFNKGRLAIIGCYSGVGKIGPFAFSGFTAWWLWLAVHWVYLPGYLSRLQVLLTWLNAFILGDRTARQRWVSLPKVPSEESG